MWYKLIAISALLSCGILLDCFVKRSLSKHDVLTKPTPGSSPNNSLVQEKFQTSIRGIDFANFTYSVKSTPQRQGKTISLRDGVNKSLNTDSPVMSLAYLAYGDATADGIEEAFVVLGQSVKGSAISHMVFVYTIESNNLILLWAFQTGDRGAGGLRQAFAENGRFVVELYGKDKLIGTTLYDLEPGVCCPKVFTRACYHWQNDRFILEQRLSSLPNDQLGAKVLMPHYSPAK